MINLSTEKLLSFAQAAKALPGHRGDGPCNPSTLWRWSKTGCRAADGRMVRLETVKLGGRSLTSEEALQRFAERLTGEQITPDELPIRTPSKRQAASERAAKKLEAAGI